jgi:ankyrin repeat protein
MGGFRAPAAAQAQPGATVSEAVSPGLKRQAAPAERLIAAAARGRVRDLRAWLTRGVPVDAADAEGNTALMAAVRARRVAAAALLLKAGADPDRPNNAGLSARDLARSLDDPDMNAALAAAP